MPTVILSACRTPIGSFGGSLKDLTAADLGAVVVREAICRAGVEPSQVGDVMLGCVLQAGAGMNVARQAALRAGLPIETPAQTVNRVCGSGLTAVIQASAALGAGDADLMVAGGTESMSNAPYLLKGARWGLRMGHGELLDSMIADGLTCAINGGHMGITAEEIVSRFGISRADQDGFAVESQQRAARAIREGRFKAEIVPVEIPQQKGEPRRFDTDEYPRADASVDRLSGLRAAFRKDGTVTAGNSSGINDGAAAFVVTTDAKARELGKAPLARLLSSATVGVDPKIMGIGPVPAIRRALDRAGLGLGEVDLVELNEAFAAQSLAVVRELGLDPARVNPYGGAIALGHPIGASGARILTTLVYALHARGGGRGVAALCVGGGMGLAVVVEAVVS
jgi:acetyl-CoA C-acetyltransferase